MFSLKLENELGNIKDIHDGESYLIVDITGLNPPPASHYTSKSYNRHGVKYNGYSIDERTITITIKLLGDVEANRNILYDWVDSGQYVKIYYSNGVRDVYCEGHVVVPDVSFFTDNEQIELEIMCDDPYFKSLKSIVTEISNIAPNFYLIDEKNKYGVPTDELYFATDDEGVVFSEDLDTNITKIVNTGNEAGVIITVVALEDIENFTIYNGQNTVQYIAMKEGQKLLKGQTLIIDTTGVRNKITIDGVSSLSKFNRNITWFTLRKGVNEFYSTPSRHVRMTIEYNERYLGV